MPGHVMGLLVYAILETWEEAVHAIFYAVAVANIVFAIRLIIFARGSYQSTLLSPTR